jgi:hypothetical protein
LSAGVGFFTSFKLTAQVAWNAYAKLFCVIGIFMCHFLNFGTWITNAACLAH